MTELRAHLFGAMRMVKSGEMEVAQAKTISELGKTLISSAKLELDYVEKLDARCESGFVKVGTDDSGQPRRIGSQST